MIERAVLGFLLLLVLAIVWFSVNHSVTDDDGEGGDRRLFELKTLGAVAPSVLMEELGENLKHFMDIIHTQGGNDDRRSRTGGGRDPDCGEEGDGAGEKKTSDDDGGKKVFTFVIPVMFIFFGVVGYRTYRARNRGNSDRSGSPSSHGVSDRGGSINVNNTMPTGTTPSLLNVATMNYEELDEIVKTKCRDRKDRDKENARLWPIVGSNDNHGNSCGNSMRIITPRASRVLPVAVATTTATVDIEGAPVVSARAVQVDDSSNAVYL